jgi:serine protease AprX
MTAMQKILLTLLVLISFIKISSAQDKYVVKLSDKTGSGSTLSPFTIGNPAAYLTTRALQRRTNQSIVITDSDLPVNPNYISQIAGTGANVIGKSKWLNTVTIQTTNLTVLSALTALPFVQSVNNVARIRSNNTIANKFNKEKLFPEKAHNATVQRTASFNYGDATNQIQMLNGIALHDAGSRGEGMVIAIIDAGFFNADNMIVFDSLRAANKILATWDFVDDNANVYDDDSHGSYCFSIMGANSPGVMVGTAPYASYYLLRSEDNFSEKIIEEYNWAEAAEYADSVGADVISSSLGYTEFDDPAMNHTYIDMDGNTCPSSIAADVAANKGMVVVVAAGNQGSSPWQYISAPSDADSVICVGAVDDVGNYAGFSSVGPSSDGQVKPTVAAQGAGTYVADVTNNGAFPGNGTSFACPVIGGLAACLWQCNPSANNMQLINAIKRSASQFATPDSLKGYGIPDFLTACSILLNFNAGFIGKGDRVDVFPNPVNNNQITFSYYADVTGKEIAISLFDISGKKVYESKSFVSPRKNNNFTINTTLANGVYFLEVLTDDNNFTKKVVKQ